MLPALLIYIEQNRNCKNLSSVSQVLLAEFRRIYGDLLQDFPYLAESEQVVTARGFYKT